MIKIGTRAHDLGKLEIEEMARALRQNGFTCTQLAFPRAFKGIDSFEDIQTTHLEKTRRAFEKYDVEIAVFSCYQDLGNPNEDIRKHAVQIFKKCMEYSKIVGAKAIGTETSYAGLTKEEKKIRFPYVLESVKEIMEYAQKMEVTVALEPVSWHPLDTISKVTEMLDTIGDQEHLKLIFDPSNLLKRDLIPYQEDYWKQWLEKIGGSVIAVHMKDFSYENDGQKYPTALGKGQIDYQPIARWLKAQEADRYLLREEIQPENVDQDRTFMEMLLNI